MAFALPTFQLGDFTPGAGVRLPSFSFGDFAPSVGLVLPSFQLGDFTPSAGLRLPIFQFAETVPSLFEMIASGGARGGGGADIAGDPFIHFATGGVTLTGEAVVVYAPVLIAHETMLGGAQVSGSAEVAIGWIQFNASGGAVVGGSATVASWESHASGGVQVGGSATVRTPVSGAEATSSATAATTAAPERMVFVVATSSAEVATTASLARAFEAAASSVAAVVGEASAYRLISAIVAGTAGVTTTAGSASTYFATAESFARVLSSIQFVADFLDGWAYNLNTGAPAFYEGFNFNSFAKIGDRYYGANAAGLFVLSGDADDTAPINALVATGTRGDKGIYRVEAVYAGARSDLPMNLTCRVEGAEYTYTFRSAPGNMAPTRVTPGKGLRGRYWQFEVANQGGADFELDSLEILPAVATRKL